MPVVEEDNSNVYKKEEDPKIDALFDESDLLKAIGDVSLSTQVDEQGYIPDPSHSPEFFTWLTDVRRRLIREYRQRTNAQPFVPLVVEIRHVLPNSVLGSTTDTASKVNAPKRPKRKNFK